jgi:hypothetical protein
MSLETTLRSALATALGASVNGVSEGPLPQGATLPWVTFVRIDTPRMHAIGGGNPVISSQPRFQFDVWAATPTSRDSVLAGLLTAVLGLAYCVRLLDQSNTYEAATGYWRARLDAKVTHAGV